MLIKRLVQTKMLILLVYFVFMRCAIAAKILAVFPSPFTSYGSVYRTLCQELAKRGHDINLITTDPFPKGQVPENITEIDFQNISFQIWRNYNDMVTSDQTNDVISKTNMATFGINKVFEQLLISPEMKKLMEEKRSYFDLLLLDASVMAITSLSHIFHSPVILVSSVDAAIGIYEVMGAPTHPFLYPSNLRQRIYNLTTWEKISELYTHLRLELTLKSAEKRANLMLKRHFGHDFPSLNELNNNVEMLFLNINPIWAGNRPVPLNVVFIGGVSSATDDKLLPEDLQTFIDKSRRGIVYVSFGDHIKPSLIHPNKIRILLNVLTVIPFDVILKWDVDRLLGLPKHIKISKQIPQSLLLKNPKIKLFITHGGLQSTDEAINAGVPLIGIPMLADEWYNTEKYVHFHIGKQVDMASLTEDKLIDAIRNVIRDESYRRNIAELRNLIFDQGELPLERAVLWTEYVLRHGARHLRSPSANISFTEYYELKLCITIVCVIFIVILGINLLFRSLSRLIIRGYDDMKKIL